MESKSNSWATTTVIGELAHLVALLGFGDPASWESCPLSNPMHFSWKTTLYGYLCRSAFDASKAHVPGSTHGANNSLKSLSGHSLSTTFQQPRHLESFSFCWNLFYTSRTYPLSFTFLRCLSLLMFYLSYFQTMASPFQAQILALEFSSSPQPHAAL